MSIYPCKNQSSKQLIEIEINSPQSKSQIAVQTGSNERPVPGSIIGRKNAGQNSEVCILASAMNTGEWSVHSNNVLCGSNWLRRKPGY